jgi:hypothetical protein
LLLTTLIVISNNNSQEGRNALHRAGKGDEAAADQVRTSSE